MNYFKFKSSAIHNLLIIEESKDENNTINEGIVIPKDILHKANIYEGQEIIVTKIGSDSWKNRIKTFAIEGSENGKVEVRGSIARFLNQGDLTCIIAESYISIDEYNLFLEDRLPIFDLGFDPINNKDNLCESKLDIQFSNKTMKNVDIQDEIFYDSVDKRSKILRMYLKSLIMGLVINKTHNDCLQGSAEIPKSVMLGAKINKYKSVSVYNCTDGGIADTYAVPMPEGVVMTTGAMACFAKIGDKVNVASYILSNHQVVPEIILTDGCKVVKWK